MSEWSGKPIEGSGAWGSHRLLSRWLDRRQLEVEQERKLAKIALETGNEVPRQTGHGPLIGSPAELRGIPAVGPRVGGAIRGTRPGDGLK
jgi:hypothetical protein